MYYGLALDRFYVLMIRTVSELRIKNENIHKNIIIIIIIIIIINEIKIKKNKKKENNFYATYSHLPNSYFQIYKTIPI